MPIYEYDCRACGRRFEVLQKMGQEELPPCPFCQSDDVSRVISPAGFVLKGTGWYTTDYPSRERREAMDKEKKSSGEGGEKKKESQKEKDKKSNKGKEPGE